MAESRTVSQRDGTYWVGFALFVVGALLLSAGIGLAAGLIVLGWVVVVVGTFLDLHTIFKRTGAAVANGYRNAKRHGK